MFIAHRCNLNGETVEENTLVKMLECINLGFSVEIDVRYIDGKYYLGHDLPQEEISLDLMLSLSSYLFIHCKNIEALYMLNAHSQLNVFGHSQDEFVITSGGNVFCSVGVVQEGAMCVMPELSLNPIAIEDMKNCSHILTDQVYRYKNEIDNHNGRPEFSLYEQWL